MSADRLRIRLRCCGQLHSSENMDVAALMGNDALETTATVVVADGEAVLLTLSNIKTHNINITNINSIICI